MVGLAPRSPPTRCCDVEAMSEPPSATRWATICSAASSCTFPAGWTLDEASLPKPGGRGLALELRAVRESARRALRPNA